MADFLTRRINILYETLREIRLNIAEVYRLNESNGSMFQLSYDQRFFIDLYTSLYNTTLRQLDYLERQLEQRNNVQFNNSNRIYINGRPYIIDHIEREIPTGETFTQDNPSPTHRPNTPVNTSLFNLNDLLNDTLRNFTNPVVVRPTQEEIESATTSRVFGSIENPTNTNCPICLDVFEPTTEVTQITQCGHIFSPSEITRWFQSNVRCPVCRFDIRESSTFNTPSQTSRTSNSNSIPRRRRSSSATSNRSAGTSTSTTSQTNNSTGARLNFQFPIFSQPSTPLNNNFSFNDISFNGVNRSTPQQFFTNILNQVLDPSGSDTLVFDAVFRA